MDSTRKAAFTWDALGRRIEHVNDVLAGTTRYYYDGVNEIVEDNGSNTRQRYYVHGVSYIDERLMMYSDSLSRPFYYVVDRMNNVRMFIDRAGAIVERPALDMMASEARRPMAQTRSVFHVKGTTYDSCGRPRIRESCGRGDMDDNTWMDGTDTTRFTAAKNGSIWDPRADLDDDGDVDSADQTLYNAKYPTWSSLIITPAVAQAFSDVDNPYMFQGVPHFALDTQAADGEDKLSLNHHRARCTDPIAGRWNARDPLCQNKNALRPRVPRVSLKCSAQPRFGLNPSNTCSTNDLYDFLSERVQNRQDPSGLCPSGQWIGIEHEESCGWNPWQCARTKEIRRCTYCRCGLGWVEYQTTVSECSFSPVAPNCDPPPFWPQACCNVLADQLNPQAPISNPGDCAACCEWITNMGTLADAVGQGIGLSLQDILAGACVDALRCRQP